MIFVEIDVKKENVQLSPPNGFRLVAIRPYSFNKGDEFLSVVLCEREINGVTSYVTWNYNSQTKGFGNGNYFGDEKRAFKDFCTRGVQL